MPPNFAIYMEPTAQTNHRQHATMQPTAFWANWQSLSLIPLYSQSRTGSNTRPWNKVVNTKRIDATFHHVLVIEKHCDTMIVVNATNPHVSVKKENACARMVLRPGS
eukprot:scaffold87865_cov64-Cyclotella_meneghiniana.AAC.3